MRCFILTCLMTISAASVRAEELGDRVKVALALAGAAPCGQCRFDETECRAEAVAKNKPLVLFVGDSCGNCGPAAREAGAVACVVPMFAGDGQPADLPRAVILSPTADGKWRTEGTLLQPTDAKVRATVAKAKPNAPTPAKPSGKKLDWETGFKVDWNDLTPAAQQRLRTLAAGTTTEVPVPAKPQPVVPQVPAQQVPGYWQPPAQPWGFPVPAQVPMTMPGYPPVMRPGFGTGPCPGGICPIR